MYIGNGSLKVELLEVVSPKKCFAPNGSALGVHQSRFFWLFDLVYEKDIAHIRWNGYFLRYGKSGFKFVIRKFLRNNPLSQ